MSAVTGDNRGLSLLFLLAHSHFAEVVGQAGEQRAAVPFRGHPGSVGFPRTNALRSRWDAPVETISIFFRLRVRKPGSSLPALTRD